ncbi:hypothetical protein GGX14DRAFT_404136 [Mycena pura]|uniref:F-box domain-containing protein n=1 Tax=Mycena pura TaxID=153505 RepID=A0AAD6UYL4_9AGAR|nr:hypothetical protein GGX14DRAFT_404136 [Mycena pura]
MLLLDLNHDVLLGIFKFLDVASVIDCSSVCSSFHALAISKHLWLSLVADLGQRLLLDLPPRDTLLTYSTEELIAEVKRVVIGPETWAANSPRPPTIHRQLHLPISKPGPENTRPPILLKGGRSLLVRRGSRCEIWNVAGAYREWAGENIIRVDAQSLPNENEMMISLEFYEGDTAPLFEVLKLDLNTGCANEAVSLKLPVGFHRMDLPVVDEDFIAHRIHWDRNGAGILVINWRERSFVILPGKFRSHALFRGHLLVPDDGEVLVYSLASFQSLWQPLTRFVVTYYSQQLAPPKPIVQQSFEPPGSGSYIATMSVHHSVLHSDRCIVSIYCYGGEWSSYFRYRFAVAASGELKNWQPISSFISTKMIGLESLSYAGYGLAPYQGAHCVCRAFGDGDRHVPLSAHKPTFLSEYSGADAALLTHQPMIIACAVVEGQRAAVASVHADHLAVMEDEIGCQLQPSQLAQRRQVQSDRNFIFVHFSGPFSVTTQRSESGSQSVDESRPYDSSNYHHDLPMGNGWPPDGRYTLPPAKSYLKFVGASFEFREAATCRHCTKMIRCLK